MKWLVAVVLAIALVCTFACSKKTEHDVNRINKQFSDDLDQFEKDASQLHSQGIVGDEDFHTMENYVVQVSDDHKSLTAQLRALPTDGTGTDKALQAVQNFVDAVNKNQLHLKSQAAQAKYDLWVSAFKSIVQSLNAALALSKPVKAEVDATVLAFVLMLIGNASTLIQKWRADGSLTDQQLQDAADAEDDETKKRALLALAGK